MTTVAHLEECLTKMTELLETQMNLVNTCMVDFIVKDMFSILSHYIQSELLSLTDDQLVSLPGTLEGVP